MNKPATISLGDMTPDAQRHVDFGRYESIDEVVREGLRALDRQEAAFDALMREKIAEARADPRPCVPMEEAFAELERRAALRRE